MTVTPAFVWASRIAAESPPNPAPTITTRGGDDAAETELHSAVMKPSVILSILSFSHVARDALHEGFLGGPRRFHSKRWRSGAVASG
jgi:hypothetical protein